MYNDTFHFFTDLLVHLPVSKTSLLISLGGVFPSFSTDLRYCIAARITSDLFSIPHESSSLAKEVPLSGKPLDLIASRVISMASCLAILTRERVDDHVS
jgi:hypothetical protein